MSIAEDEAKERFKGMYQDDMREVYVLGRTAPPAAAEIEAVAKDEDDAWDYAGEIPGFQEEYIRQAKEMLEIARKAVSE